MGRATLGPVFNFTLVTRWFGRRRRAQEERHTMLEGTALDLSLLFDAEKYRESGACPWTFFAYPTSVAVAHGLPPDEMACRFLGDVQSSGIEVTIWVSLFGSDTTYLGCKAHDIDRLRSVLVRLESDPQYGRGFCEARTSALLSLADESGEAEGAPVPESQVVAARLAASCLSPSEAIASLSKGGFTKIDAISAIVGRFGLEVGEAKILVDVSDSWREVHARDSEFHDAVERLLDEFEGDD